MRTRVLPGLAAMMVASLCFSSAAAQATARPPQVAAAPPTILAQPGNAFIALANSGNTSGMATSLDDSQLNHQPGTRLLLTNQYHPEGAVSAFDPHPTSVFYQSSTSQWQVLNGDSAAMPNYPAWNVFIPPQDDTLIVITSTLANTPSGGARTEIDDPQFNGQPNALIFVQHTATPGLIQAGQGPSGYTAITTTLSVAYEAGTGKWTIQTADGSPMPALANFYVLKASADETTFTHVTSSANHLFAAGTELDNPLINGNPDALLLIAQNYGTGVTNQALNHVTAVNYQPAFRRWFILNQDGASMPNGVMFNVLVIPPKQGGFVNTADHSGHNYSQINNPDLNGNPYARLYVMHDYDPAESTNLIADDHPLGVLYSDDGHWYVYNRDSQPLPAGATFNVYYAWPRGNAFTVAASPANTTTAPSLLSQHLSLNSPLFNSQPDAIPLQTFNKRPNGVGSPDFVFPVGVRYNSAAWEIFNDFGLDRFGPNVSFNVLAPPADSSFVVTATAGLGGNITGAALVISHPLTDGHARALLFVSPRDNGGIDEHNLGMYYNLSNKWSILNEDGAAMVDGQAFDVFVIPRFQALLPLVVK